MNLKPFQNIVPVEPIESYSACVIRNNPVFGDVLCQETNSKKRADRIETNYSTLGKIIVVSIAGAILYNAFIKKK